MKRIYEQTKIVKQILGEQAIDDSKRYRKFFYLIESPVDSGMLLYNTLTYELLLLDNQEYNLFNNPDFNNSLCSYLAKQFFLVPEDFNDKKMAEQVISTRIQIQNVFTNPPLTSFVILPTTGCNARCFYCFELGAKVSNMTEQTAHDVADFIERKGTKKVRLQWFGGEPLINIKAIDTICKDLTEKGIKFTSRMVSNAYLLDEEAIKKAVELWNLDTIQITLDGTEEVYNKVKNYVYKDVSSPFIKVLNNIENALKANIQVNIRLNMDAHNQQDLFDLSKLLVEKFRKYNNCYIYVVRLYGTDNFQIKDRDASVRHDLIKNSIALQKYIDDNMPKIIVKNLPNSINNPNTCIANSDSTVMILPHGHLGKCEHFVDSEFFGNIYSDDWDLKQIAKFKERKMVCEKCYDCEYRSLCLALKCCSSIPNYCDDIDKMAITNRLHTKLRNIYNSFLELEKDK